MSIQESGEMYLESILILSDKLPKVRSIDIANYRDYSRASVSRALNVLKEGDYIQMDDSGFITLTAKGRERAETIYNRHKVLTNIFVELGVSQDVATEDACRMEHYISEETFSALKEHFGYGNDI